MKISTETHEQAMACLNCALAGMVPDSHFPLEPGLWESACPQCGAVMVWITAIRSKQPTPRDQEPPK